MTVDRPYPLVRPGFAKATTVVFVLLAPFVAHAIWDYVEERRLGARIRAVVSSGAPTTTRHPFELSPDAARADEYYRAAAALVTRGHVAPARWEDYTQALEFVDRASALPFEGFAPGSSYSYLISEMVTLSRLCERRAVERAREGDANGAYASLFAVAQLIRTHPWAVYPQIESVKTVASTSVASDVRQRVERVFAAVDRPDGVIRSIELNRALLLEQMGAESHRRPTIDAWLWRPWTNHLSVRRLDEYATLIAGGTPARGDGMTGALISMRDVFRRRAAVVHCEHQVVAGDVSECGVER
jgi:hypothetical protein